MRDEATKLGMLEGAESRIAIANAITITACVDWATRRRGGHLSLVEVTQAAGSAVDVDVGIGIGIGDDNGNQLLSAFSVHS